jgi:HK97 family phage major capsid protein
VIPKTISNKGKPMSEFLSAQVEQRQKLWHEAKAVLETAEAEKRELTAEEQGKFETLSAELDKRAAFIADARKTAEREERAAIAAEGFNTAAVNTQVDADRIRAMARGEVRSYEFGQETRALAPATLGAPLPTSFYSQVIMKAKYVGPMLTTSTMLRTNSGEPLQIPSVSAYSAGTQTAAGSVLSDSDPSFNSFVTLQSWKFGGIIRVARELLEDTGVDLLGFLADQIGLGLGSSVNAALTTGTGTTQPTGIVNAASSALTGGTGVSGAFTADNLISLAYSLDPAARRRPGAGFMMNTSSLAAVRSFKDTYGRYIFEPSLSAEKNDILLGFPIWENPDMAATATNAKSVIFGDLASFYVREVGGIRLDRSDDFAFSNDQVTFRYTWRGDSNLPQTSHIKYFKGAAS